MAHFGEQPPRIRCSALAIQSCNVAAGVGGTVFFQQEVSTAMNYPDQLRHVQHARTIVLVLECLAILCMLIIVGTRMFAPHWIMAFALTLALMIYDACTVEHALSDGLGMPKSAIRR